MEKKKHPMWAGKEASTKTIHPDARSKFDFKCEEHAASAHTLMRTLAKLTGYSKPEVTLLYEAVCAVLHMELVAMRPIMLPGVGRLVPQQITNVRKHNIMTGGWTISPTWVQVRFQTNKELVKAYRVKHPFYTMDEKGEAIYPIAD